MCDPSSCPHCPHSKKLHFSVRALPEHPVLARSWNVPKPQQEAGPWPHRHTRAHTALRWHRAGTSCSTVLVLASFMLGLQSIVLDCWSTLRCYGPLEMIISLHRLKWSLNCSVSLSLGAHEKPEVAAKSCFHSLSRSAAWYLLMQH